MTPRIEYGVIVEQFEGTVGVDIGTSTSGIIGLVVENTPANRDILDKVKSSLNQIKNPHELVVEPDQSGDVVLQHSQSVLKKGFRKEVQPYNIVIGTPKS